MYRYSLCTSSGSSRNMVLCRYLCEEMLDDCGQSLHSLVPLDEQPPQLADGLVPLLRLLLALTGFSRGRRRSVRHRCCGRAGLGCILQTGACPGTGSHPHSRLGPRARASTGAAAGGVGGRCRWSGSLRRLSCCLRDLVGTRRAQVDYKFIQRHSNSTFSELTTNYVIYLSCL